MSQGACFAMLAANAAATKAGVMAPTEIGNKIHGRDTVTARHASYRPCKTIMS